jgi:hypothetical protein
MDSWYTCRRLWRRALGRGWAITGGLKSNQLLAAQAVKAAKLVYYHYYWHTKQAKSRTAGPGGAGQVTPLHYTDRHGVPGTS